MTTSFEPGSGGRAGTGPRLAPEHEIIVGLIPEGSRVLDLGCGNGDLLAALMARKGVRAEGIEIAPECIQACVARGLLNVHQGDLEGGLADYPDQAVDYAILTNTIQVLRKPLALIQEMARVGRRCIVGLPNFAHWRCRAQLAFAGRMPKTSRLPYEWYDTPNIHLATLKDFRQACRRVGLDILREIALRTGETSCKRASLAPNLLADYAIFIVAAGGRIAGRDHQAQRGGVRQGTPPRTEHSRLDGREDTARLRPTDPTPPHTA